MTSGRPLTDREQMHILRWANKKTWGQIADEIADMSPDRKRRSPIWLSTWFNRYLGQSKTIQVNIPESVQKDITDAGLDDVAISYILSSYIKSYASLQKCQNIVCSANFV